MEFVIIGGDAAGMSAASRAKRHRPDIRVTVLEMTRDVSYSACGMPYNIADPERGMDDLVVRSARVFQDKQGIDIRLSHEALEIDPATRRVSGVDPDGRPFAIPYDKLLIATGAAPIRPEIPGIDLPGVLVLKNLEDGRKLKEYLASRKVEKAVIIGMGYIALEMCEALAARGVSVDMIKPRPGLLPWMARELSDRVREELAANKVGILDGHEIERISAGPGGGLQVVSRDTAIPCDMVLAAVGVTPVSGIAAKAGLALGPRDAVAVDTTLRTSDTTIYAAGDCADAFHVVTGERVWIPLALRANRAGWAAADNVCGIESRLPGIAGTAVFKVFDLEVARTGLSSAEAGAAGFDPETAVIKTRSRAHAHPGSAPIHVE
ncbi:FAD/NAD(P)-binding oxidoreductase, partial [Desulfococcus sp.]|uniref:NAD(P)/FAD-dependent oxidoreductase n=1 Tax=Desulfococcus sp. TaxID=2025834 RepID=UPI00359457C4